MNELDSNIMRLKFIIIFNLSSKKKRLYYELIKIKIIENSRKK